MLRRPVEPATLNRRSNFSEADARRSKSTDNCGERRKIHLGPNEWARPAAKVPLHVGLIPSAINGRYVSLANDREKTVNQMVED